MNLKLVPAEMSQAEGWFEETSSDLKLVPVALSEDGWADEKQQKRPVSSRAVAMGVGDRVLYQCGNALVPAVLVELAVGGWWARDSRHGRSLFHLSAEDVVTRLPRPDLVGEAA